MVKEAIAWVLLFILGLSLVFLNGDFLEWLKDNDKLAGWLQALLAGFAILFVIWSSRIPGYQSKKDAADRKRKNASMFIAKYQMTISRDLVRINEVISSFEKISSNPKGNYQSFIDLVRIFCNIQVSNISDYEWAYDISPRMLKIISEAQSHGEVGYRALERSMKGVSVARDGAYVQEIIDRCSSFFTEYWFVYDDQGQFEITAEGAYFEKNLLELRDLISSADEIAKRSAIG